MRSSGPAACRPRPHRIFVIANCPNLPSAAGSGIEATENEESDMSESGKSLVVMVQIDGVTDSRL